MSFSRLENAYLNSGYLGIRMTCIYFEGQREIVRDSNDSQLLDKKKTGVRKKK